MLYLRRQYHLGAIRIMWYMERYHAITISESTVMRILRRHGLRRLPQRSGRRAVHTRRYNKQVPGHHIQIDVKFLTFNGNDGAKLKRYQYTAIDDATRVRALQIYDRHTQKNAIHFVNHVIEKIPFSYPANPYGPRPRVPGAASLACGRPGYSPCVHQS